MTTSLTALIEPRFRIIDGLKIRYADSGGAGEHAVLLTSPWPESIYAFTRMWPTLAEHARLVAIDLPGFGASERRDELMSPRAMGGFLAQLIAEADLGTPHVVAPDVGTSAALFAAAAHPDLMRSVITGSGGAAVPLQLGEPLRSRVLDPDLDTWRTMDPRATVGKSLDTIAGGIPDEIRADYLASYEGDRYVESMRYVRSVPRGAAGARRATAADHDAGHARQRSPRPRCPARERRVPRRAATSQPVGGHRRRPLRLGGGAGGVRLDDPRHDRHVRPMTARARPEPGCSTR